MRDRSRAGFLVLGTVDLWGWIAAFVEAAALCTALGFFCIFTHLIAHNNWRRKD